jgi:hypothetical protein
VKASGYFFFQGGEADEWIDILATEHASGDNNSHQFLRRKPSEEVVSVSDSIAPATAPQDEEMRTL